MSGRDPSIQGVGKTVDGGTVDTRPSTAWMKEGNVDRVRLSLDYYRATTGGWFEAVTVTGISVPGVHHGADGLAGASSLERRRRPVARSTIHAREREARVPALSSATWQWQSLTVSGTHQPIVASGSRATAGKDLVGAC